MNRTQINDPLFLMVRAASMTAFAAEILTVAATLGGPDWTVWRRFGLGSYGAGLDFAWRSGNPQKSSLSNIRSGFECVRLVAALLRFECDLSSSQLQADPYEPASRPRATRQTEDNE